MAGPRARRVRRHGPRPRRRARADQLERLRHRAGGARRSPTPSGLLDAADVAGALWPSRASPPTLAVLHPAIERRPTGPRAGAHARPLPRAAGGQLPLGGGSRPQPAGSAHLPQHGSPSRRPRARAVRARALGCSRVELNAAQGNPLVSVDDGRILSASAYEVVGLVGRARLRPHRARHDAHRGLASAAVKLLDTPWSGLPTGLLDAGRPRSRAQHPRHHRAVRGRRRPACWPSRSRSPSTSSAGAEGIEDRASHAAALRAAARRDGGALGEGVVAIELVACRAPGGGRARRVDAPLQARPAPARRRARSRAARACAPRRGRAASCCRRPPSRRTGPGR